MESAPLFGRRRDIAAVCGHLRRADVRLLTLTGSPGIGKTRLAVAIARTLAGEFRDGAAFVDLSGISEPGLVAHAIVQALRLREGPVQSPLARLKLQLRSSRLLIVLDNFEHVLDAAEQVHELLAACAGLKIVVTSREPLHLSWEHEVPVPPLALPSPSRSRTVRRLMGNPAVALFAYRAQAANPQFKVTASNAGVIAEICTRLDGIPLAIELAASRSKLLSAQEILARLSPVITFLAAGFQDHPARHHTLRAAIAWSHDLLKPPERILFRRLAVFVGGWDLEAVERISLMMDPRIEATDTLAALVDKSLLVRDPRADGASWMRMLESIREFAFEQLVGAGELERCEELHAQFFIHLAEQVDSAFGGPGQEPGLMRLERDHDNLRAALRWLAARGDARGLHLAGRLWRFWFARGYMTEGRAWLEEMLARRAPEATERAWALNGLAALTWVQGDDGRAHALAQEAHELAQRIGDRRSAAYALLTLAIVANLRGENAQVVALCGDGLPAARKLRDRWLISRFVGVLGAVEHRLGRFRRAAAQYTECLNLAREMQDIWTLCLALENLGRLASDQGDAKRAAGLLGESLGYAHALGHQWLISRVLESMAEVALTQQRLQRAVRLFAAADVLRATITTPLRPIARMRHDRSIGQARGDLGDVAFDQAWASGQAMPTAEAIRFALTDLDAAAPPGTPALRPRGPLTHREQEVATLIAQGLTNREIARRLQIAERTTAVHVQHIFNRLGLTSRTQIAVWKLQHSPL